MIVVWIVVWAGKNNIRSQLVKFPHGLILLLVDYMHICVVRERDENISGGISGALDPNSKEAVKHAERYYDSVRKMSTDISNIAENTDNTIEYISKIKEHLFLKEHDLGEYGVKYFDSDYDIAQSWQRLIDGKNIQAHDVANQEFNYKKSLNEWRK